MDEKDKKRLDELKQLFRSYGTSNRRSDYDEDTKTAISNLVKEANELLVKEDPSEDTMGGRLRSWLGDLFEPLASVIPFSKELERSAEEVSNDEAKAAMAKGAILTDEEFAAGKEDAEAASRKSEERRRRNERASSVEGDEEENKNLSTTNGPAAANDSKDSSTDSPSSLGDNPPAEAAAEVDEEKKAAARAAIPYETLPAGSGPGAGFLRTPRAVMAQVAMRGGKTPAMKAAEQSATNASIAEINRLRKTDPEAADALQSAFTGRPSRTSSFPEGMEVVQTRDEGGETVSRSTRIAIPEKFGGGSAFGDTGKGRGTASKKGRFGEYGTGQNEFGSLTRDLMDSSFKPGTGIIDRDKIRDFGRGTTGMGDLIAGPGGDIDRGLARDQVRRNEEFEKLKKKGMAADLAAKQKKDDDDDDDDDLTAAAKVKARKDLMNRTQFA